MAARFAPVDIRADLTTLPSSERRALAKLVDADRLSRVPVDIAPRFTTASALR